VPSGETARGGGCERRRRCVVKESETVKGVLQCWLGYLSNIILLFIKKIKLILVLIFFSHR
jgi:hypothetical protein